MKTYLKLVTLAIVLIAPAGAYAADPVAGPIDSHQEAQQEPQQEPQRIPDPVEFFDKRTGKPKVWYWRTESGYEFYDAPGFHPRTGGVLTSITREVISDWLRSQNNLKQCYIIQRDAQPPVIYRDHPPGIDPETGRECRLVTIGLVERLNEYANGKRPGKIKVTPSEFFDPRTSEPIVWYVDRGGTIEIFDLLGHHPETGEELLAVTPEIVDRWKAQQAQAARRSPRRVDPEKHDFFDPKTGKPNIWYSPGENGALEFFDGPGFHPRSGKALTEITEEFAKERSRAIQERIAEEERERQKRIADQKRERQKQIADQERERQKQIADQERERQNQIAEQQEQRRQQSVLMCDELAANPNDQNRRRTSRGVSYDALKTHVTEAIQACEVAAQQTNDLTSQYQLARAVELLDPPRGQSMQDRLVKQGYPAAFDNAGSLLLHDRGCRQHCVNEAVKLFKRGAALGDPDSMMSLADQISNGQATGDVIALYQRAAKLGHPGAIRALEALAQAPRPTFRFPF
jgi:hypothetical protein